MQSFVRNGIYILRLQNVLAVPESRDETDRIGTHDDCYRIPFLMSIPIRGIYIPAHVFVFESHFLIDRDDLIVPACGISQYFGSHNVHL